MAEDKIEHSTEKQLIATEFIISKSDEFGKSFFVQRCSELIVTLRAERKKVEQHAQEHANWFKEFYKQTGAPENVSPIVAYNAERKATEKLAEYIADYHRGMVKSGGVDKPEFWLKYAREENDNT